MKDEDIDDILNRAAQLKQDLDPILLNRISASIGSSLRPVRPLPASWILVVRLVLIYFAVAAGSALLLGPHGVEKMSRLDTWLIFPVLGILAWLAANLSVAQIIPGSRRLMSPWLLAGSGCIALGAVFGLLFHDYGTEQFLSQGFTCLRAGLGVAIPASLAMWWILRRGFAVNPVTAGLAAGTLAGLAGVTMLELHCVNFEAPHRIVWHIAVMPVSAGAGACLAFAASAYGRRREAQRRPAASG